MDKKYTYEQLMELAKEKFNKERIEKIDFEIKYCRGKSDCPINSPSNEGGWTEIGEGCWKRMNIKTEE